jgi:hypothetical protein
MSFILQSELDREYIVKLCKEIRLIKQSKIDWTVEDVLRFASLIKVEDSISDIILSWEIDGSKLFDIEYLSANLDCIVTDRNYMPLYKLFYVVSAILHLTDPQDGEGEPRQPEWRPVEESEVEIAEEAIVSLREELEKLNNVSVIELGSAQLARLLKGAQLGEESACVTRWGVDGFSLVCMLGSDDGQTLRNYFSNEDVQLLVRLSHLFLHLYYAQHARPAPEPTNDLRIDDFGVEFNDIHFDQSRSFHSSQYGVSEQGDFRPEEEEFAGQALRNSEYGVSERGSVGVSEYAESVRGSVGVSEAGSVRGSTRGSTRVSVVESEYASSEVESMQASSKKENVIAVSSIEDDSILASLMSVALKLPFNLLNL